MGVNRTPSQPVSPVRRWPRRIAVTLIFAGIGITGWGIALWLTSPRALPITSIAIEGDLVHIDRNSLETRLRTSITGGFFSLDIDGLAAVIAAEPWVRAVGIRREWPGRLRIHVVEQVAVVQWGDDALLNAEADVFAPPRESFPAGLPRLSGATGRERELLARYEQAREQLAAQGFAVRGLTEDARRALTIELQNGTQIVMGRGEDGGRLARLVRVWPRLAAQRSGMPQRIDLRYTNGFAVAWGDAAAVTQTNEAEES